MCIQRFTLKDTQLPNRKGNETRTIDRQLSHDNMNHGQTYLDKIETIAINTSIMYALPLPSPGPITPLSLGHRSKD
jgi:hypothetical protein